MNDIYIKDEGDFVTVIFQSDRALSFAREGGFAHQLYGRKLDIDLNGLWALLEWAEIQGLSVDSEVEVVHHNINFSNN